MFAALRTTIQSTSQSSSLLFSGLCALLLSGCPAQKPMQVPPGQPAVLAPGPADTSARPIRVSPAVTQGPRESGGSCFVGSDCASTTCEGASCDRKTPGTCVPENRICTADAVEYCGCDGKTFIASSSCPGESFATKGACVAEP